MLALATCKRESPPSPPTGPSLPGAEPFDGKLYGSLAAELEAKGPQYVARTKHKDAAGQPIYTNRLIAQKSPYLLQHAHNPVNWYPWGDEAFEAAKRLDRPVLISIGYSTCHWCHVMEEESFEDVEIAAYLNANYIAIKVDREERPDVDSVYMSALQAMGQNGGWPLNVWLTPDRKPFFGGTYFPPRAGVRGARVGFTEILARAKEQFDTNRAQLTEQADKVAAAIGGKHDRQAASTSLDGAAVLARAGALYRKQIDRNFGGLLNVRSKFPSSVPVRFLLRHARSLTDAAARVDVEGLVKLTLDQMRNGGVYDQVGGGFHRYSVDPKWAIPHFEKMLYDNALAVMVYLDAFQAVGDARYAGVASDVVAYLVREMRSPDFGFYSATDADSQSESGHREEGAFFVWTPRELAAVLSSEELAVATTAWVVSARGNFEGKNNLTVKAVGDDANPALIAIRDKLLAERAKRAAPGRDDKILAAWNGLILSALARSAAVLPPGFKPPPPARGAGLDYQRLAVETAEFISTKLIEKGRLRRVYSGGSAYGDAFAEDYAFVIAGLIELFEAGGDPRWLKQAIALQKTLEKRYKAPGGAFFKTADDAEKLLAREIPDRDGAIPSANSVSALNLMRLYELTSEPHYLERAEAVIGSFGDQLMSSPNSLSEMLIALEFRQGRAKEIVLAGSAASGFGPLEDVLRTTWVPRSVVVRKAANAPSDLVKVVPLTQAKTAIGGQPTAFVCEQSRCELPTSDPAVFARQLSKQTAER